jgi:TPR repeat protein
MIIADNFDENMKKAIEFYIFAAKKIIIQQYSELLIYVIAITDFIKPAIKKAIKFYKKADNLGCSKSREVLKKYKI